MAGPGPNPELVPDFPPKLVGEGPLPNEGNEYLDWLKPRRCRFDFCGVSNSAPLQAARPTRTVKIDLQKCMIYTDRS